MKIAALLGVKDEVELIEGTIRHLEAIGVDRIMVYDGYSTDGTERVLKRCVAQGRITLHQVHDDEIDGPRDLEIQLELMRQSQADWVLSIDADEYPLPRTGNLKDCPELADGGGDIVRIDRLNVVLDAAGLCLPDPPSPERYDEVLVVAETVPSAEYWSDPRHAEQTPWIRSAINPKVIARLDKIAGVTDGMHDFIARDKRVARKIRASSLFIAHVPFSTRARFRRKIDNVTRLMEAHEAEFETQGRHWKRWRRLAAEGCIDEEFDRQVFGTADLLELRRSGIVRSAAEWFARGSSTK